MVGPPRRESKTEAKMFTECSRWTELCASCWTRAVDKTIPIFAPVGLTVWWRWQSNKSNSNKQVWTTKGLNKKMWLKLLRGDLSVWGGWVGWVGSDQGRFPKGDMTKLQPEERMGFKQEMGWGWSIPGRGNSRAITWPEAQFYAVYSAWRIENRLEGAKMDAGRPVRRLL